MTDRPFDAPNLLRHAAGRLYGFPDISEDLLDAADEIERLRAERDELQAKIDAYAAAVHRKMDVLDAQAALLAAASVKEER